MQSALSTCHNLATILGHESVKKVARTAIKSALLLFGGLCLPRAPYAHCHRANQGWP
ncbi:hypothetical protein [Kibdelosporangium philippinense]|uniref:hypothetical protein n=1 Tax=Kibdelosporangium philippinense TaxID=211113 RepID=UPI00360B37E5